MSDFVKSTLPFVIGSEGLGMIGTGVKTKDKEKVMERVHLALVRLGKLSLLYGGLHLLTGTKLNKKYITFLYTFGLHSVLQTFSWNLSLYFCLRAIGGSMIKNKVEFHLHPIAIFLCHMVHNELLMHRAELVEPSYLKLWFPMTADYKNLDDWYNHFRSETAREPHYKDSLLHRKTPLWRRVLLSFKRQYPFVLALNIIPLIVFNKKTRQVHFKDRQSAMNLVSSLLLNVTRSSFVLACLPYVLTEFPSVYNRITSGSENKPQTKAKLLHIIVASLASSVVFLAERKPRLQMMIVYTYWRCIEAFIRGAIKDNAKTKEEEKTLKQTLASVFTATTVLVTTTS